MQHVSCFYLYYDTITYIHVCIRASAAAAAGSGRLGGPSKICSMKSPSGSTCGVPSCCTGKRRRKSFRPAHRDMPSRGPAISLLMKDSSVLTADVIRVSAAAVNELTLLQFSTLLPQTRSACDSVGNGAGCTISVTHSFEGSLKALSIWLLN